MTEKPGIIKLLKCDSISSPFESYKLKNAYDFDKEKKEMKAFDSALVRDLENFLFTFGDRIFSGKEADSAIAAEFFKKDQEIYRRDLEYILQNSKSYYSFWYFRRNIARRVKCKTAQLLLCQNMLSLHLLPTQNNSPNPVYI